MPKEVTMNASSQELSKILELTKLLNSSQDVKYILNEMMNRTLNIIQSADIAVIFLYDKEKQDLCSMASVGFGDRTFRLNPNESITGQTFVTKKTLHLKTHEEMIEAMASLKASTKSSLEKGCVQPISEIQSSISCPLIHNNECIGVFVLDNFQSKPAMTEKDVYLAELISLNATIAIINASNYKQMIEEKDRYAYSMYLHNKFTEMVLKGESIQDIIEEVSQMRDKDMLVIDAYKKITHIPVNTCQTHKTLSATHMWFSNRLSVNNQTLYHDDKDQKWWLYNPIRVDETFLGWVAIISPTNNFPELERITLDKCSTIIALEIIKNEELLTLEYSLKGDFFENLLSNESKQVIEVFSKRYGYDFHKPHQLIITQLKSPRIDNDALKNNRYLYKEFKALNHQYLLNSITLLKQNLIITIFDSSHTIKRETLVELIHQYEEQAALIASISKTQVNITTIVSKEIGPRDSFKNIYEQTIKLFNLNICSRNTFSHFFFQILK